MPADDIYLSEFHFEGPTSAASFGIHYQEVVLHTGSNTSPQELAAALLVHFQSELLGVLSNDWHFTAITVRVQNNAAEPHFRQDIVDGIGLRAGPGLPANMSWFIKQAQGLFPAKSNGRVFIPGLGESDTLIGVLTNAFLTGPAQDLGDKMLMQVSQVASGAGRWEAGIISRKVLNLNPPIKDWEGAFSAIQSATAWAIISSQRKRKTRAIGAAEVTPP